MKLFVLLERYPLCVTAVFLRRLFFVVEIPLI